MVIACPDGLVATNFCSPIHFTVPVCIRTPPRRAPQFGCVRTWHDGIFAVGGSAKAFGHHVNKWSFYASNAQTFGFQTPEPEQSKRELKTLLHASDNT
jgi:hypothetical protein